MALTEVEVEERVQQLAQALLPRSKEIAAVATDMCLRTDPALAPVRIPDSARNVGESNEQYVGAALSMLAFGMVPGSIEPPPGTMKALRHLVATGAGVNSIFLGYRLCHQATWEAWFEHVAQALDSAPVLNAVLRHSSPRVFNYFNTAATQFVTRYERELAGTGTVRSTRELVEAVLRGQRLDLPHARDLLGYDLHGFHVALVVTPIVAGIDTRAAVDIVLSDPDLRARSLVISDVEGSWVWLSSTAKPVEDALSDLAATRADGVVIGMGEVGRGPEGFRRSHEQAREAARIGRLSSSPEDGVVRHRDVEFVSLLCAEPDRARAFAADRLAGLAGRDEATARLRETVRVFLAHGSNKARAADLMHVHHKTIAYRLTRAAELLGQDLEEAGPELEAALFIDRTLNGA
ncbi:MAG: PucR family transcriptional regulator [Sporichthyaceae bacterium]